MNISTALAFFELVLLSTLSITTANASAVLVQDGNFSGSVTSIYGGYSLGGAWKITGGTLFAQFIPANLGTVASVYSNEQGYPTYLATKPYGSFVNEIEPVLTASPSGGNFFGDDGHYPVTISQSIAGLTPGNQYDLSFYQAAAVETSAAVWPNNSLSSIPVNWAVSLGGNSTTQYSAVISLTPQAGHLAYGHTTPVSSVTTNGGWEQVNMVFTATSATETLAFIAQGPGGVPPIALLSDVSLSAYNPFINTVNSTYSEVPEPAQWALFLLGLPLIIWTRAINRNRNSHLTWICATA